MYPEYILQPKQDKQKGTPTSKKYVPYAGLTLAGHEMTTKLLSHPTSSPHPS